MSKIRTYQDLLEEKRLLEAQLTVQRRLIRADVVALKEEWSPLINLVSGPAKFASGKFSPLLSIGAGLLGEVLVKNVLLARSGWITRVVVSLLSKNQGSLARGGASVLRQLIGRFKNRSLKGLHANENGA